MSEASKFDDGKPPMNLISGRATRAVARVLEFGAEKYEAHNWRKGMKWSRLYAAVLRHLFADLDGEDRDPDSGLPHIAHAACGLMFLLDFRETYPEGDDRYVPPRLDERYSIGSEDSAQTGATDPQRTERPCRCAVDHDCSSDGHLRRQPKNTEGDQ